MLNSGETDPFWQEVERRSNERVESVHSIAKKIWGERQFTPVDLQNKCIEKWEEIGNALGTRILPLVPVSEEGPVSNLVFGSGGFSTGFFQAKQYKVVEEYAPKPPVTLLGLVANRSSEHGCNAFQVSEKLGVPLVELDFEDWYRENIDDGEEKPILATRFWFSADDSNRPPESELIERFRIRQELFHGALGRRISEDLGAVIDTVSARGYSFQFCSSLFPIQDTIPMLNDTHPADLTYVDPGTGERLYPGWQSGPIRRMMRDGLVHIVGSLIKVEFMDRIEQIYELDEGALLAMGEGVFIEDQKRYPAREVQNALKLIDDYVFCALEPTGLILAWGISEDKLPVTYRDLRGNRIELMQNLIVVGGKIRSGINTWGKDLFNDLKELDEFLFP
jgi:hypothetical protein